MICPICNKKMKIEMYNAYVHLQCNYLYDPECATTQHYCYIFHKWFNSAQEIIQYRKLINFI